MKLVLLAVILSCCFVHACCTQSQCSAEQAAIVQQQWTSTFASDYARLLHFGMSCVLRLFEQDVPAPPSSGGAAGAGQLMTKLGRAIELLSDQDALQARIEEFRARQSSQTNAAHAEAFLSIVLETLPQFVGESYDEDAWRDCLTMLVQRLVQS